MASPAVSLPESDLRKICQLTGIWKKGPAIRKVVDDVLRLERRAEISQKFLSGEWSAELDTFEATLAIHHHAELITFDADYTAIAQHSPLKVQQLTRPDP